MKKIQCLIDFNNLVDEISSEFLEYLNSEFYSLYEYLSNGERLEEFLLDNHQAIKIVENSKELDLLLQNTLGLEYVEEVQLKTITCLRIGIFQLEDIQLHYFLKE
ncbi:hypothetical protein [Metabacillus niabensis]|uniref:hypothetical protein n=1 Tax=Metabacillus niabensis TaxID=324854 RepID=UPI001CF9EC29|nr:hypothetical protein [Metabacillus niabensis]